MADNSSFAEKNRMLIGSKYRFFNRADHPSAPDDYPTYYSELLSLASVSIKIWDPYFNIGDEDLFTVVPVGVDVIILYTYITSGSSRNLQPQDVKSRVEPKLPIGHGTLKVAYLPDNDATLFEKRKWHDRFLIIDDAFYYLIGASLRYQHTSANCFGIYDLENHDDIALVKERFDKILYEVENKGYVI